MKVLITGANGQLGLSIKKLSPSFPDVKLVYTDVGELDITNESELEEFFGTNTFDFVVNCAAYTAVDRAEEEPETAFLVNTKAVEYLSRISSKYGFGLIQISTDFVFNGKKSRPYLESDKPNPISVYSKTKAEAEQAVMEHAKHAMIIRTSWLYSEFGHNFVKTILKYARQKDELKVVFDQIGTPTYAEDLARAILTLVSRSRIPTIKSIYHYSNEGVASWFDFAKAITDIAGIECKINPVSTEEYPLPATRPAYSVMSKALFSAEFNLEIPYWRDSLKKCLIILMEEN